MIKETWEGVLVDAKVRPGSKDFTISMFDKHLTIELKSQARDGKANMELVKEMKRYLGKDVKIIRGKRSKNKLILIRDMNKRELNKLFSF